MERQQRLRASAVKIRDLEESRARWRQRALAAEQALTEASKAAQKGAKTAGGEDGGNDTHPGMELSAPGGHQSPTVIMQFAIEMVVYGCLSSRAVHWVLERLGTWFPVAAPAYTSVLNWVYRCGLHILNRPVERRTDWIFVADHTIALGQSKCLVILGIAASELERTGFSPSHRDMQVLAIETTSHSTGPWCAQVLAEVAERVGNPVQIVADRGSDLRQGITLFQQQAPQSVDTYDISHRIATLFKAALGKDSRWNGFLAQCRHSFASLQQTELAFLLPPRQRTKARFMHVDAHIDWAQQLLGYFDRGDFSAIQSQFVLHWPQWQTLAHQLGWANARPLRALIGVRYPSKAALCQAFEATVPQCLAAVDATFWEAADSGRQRFLEGFGWVLDDREDLTEYAQLIERSKTIQSYLKSNGLRRDARAQIEARLAGCSAVTPRVAAVTERILDHVAEEAAKVPENLAWLASSDIIESVFGTYKCFTARGPLKEIGKLVLTIPAFVCNLTTQLVREAVETVRMIDVDNWVETHLGTSMLARRRRALRPLRQNTKTA